ncbi:MAG: D-alanine--D-alanine ligase [Nitrosomonas sp.]|uniref:D-alanine--D-alanine ligase family protein n=1 Tax=Nitrosomonas sp. TaxID=42353 RepID=UPI0025E4A1CA|nr:D-alanine--D-alanine ligase [Nitrosomonas sp.]UJP02356.1 MAG: D-alanine--D-alanine ligase [Nitrosomonas sp.]
MPVFHGQGGEDGSIQGLLEFLGLPYGGCNLEGLALGIDKILTKQCCEAVGLAVAPWTAIDSAAWGKDPAACLERCRPLGLPLFIKPARLGSSIGLSRVTRFEDLAPAIQAALNRDSRILIEAQAQGIEYVTGIVGNQAQPLISAVAESTLRSDSYDYEAKDSADALDDIVPARLDADTTAQLQDFALKVWRALDMRGLARIDCFLGPQSPILNEVNTMPGLSAWAPFVMAWRHIGVNAPDLMDLIVQEALNRSLVR